MPGVPAFILRRLYVKGSLTEHGRGVAVSTAEFTRFGLREATAPADG